MKSLLDKLTERWIGVRMLEEEAKAEDVVEMLRMSREQIRAHMRQTMGDNFCPGGGASEAGGTHIGDVVHHHTHTETNTGGPGKKWLVRGLVAAALLGSGAGATSLLNLFGLSGGGGVTLPVDRDTTYDLILGEPDAVPRSEKEDKER